MIRSKLHIYELSKCVYFLNRHLIDLNESLKVCEPEQRATLQSVSGGLYRLKERVILKMLNEGYCVIKNCETHQGKKRYIVNLKPGVVVNLAITSRVRQAIKEYNPQDDFNFQEDSRKTTINLEYNFDDISGKLNAYMKDELEIIDELDLPEGIKRKEPIQLCKDKNYTDIEELIKAVAVINAVIILRFQANERPRSDWNSIWKKSSAIAAYLTEAESLLFEGEGFFYRRGYLFYCKIYFKEGLGQLVVLDYPCQVLPYGDNDENGFEDSQIQRMPQIISWSNNKGIRRQSADLIRKYKLEPTVEKESELQ